MIQKGLISTIAANGMTAVVTPYNSGTVSHTLVVPAFLIGALEVNTAVVYAFFPDNTGIILARMDGEWSNKLSEDVALSTGEKLSELASSYHEHIHTDSYGGTTSRPN